MAPKLPVLKILRDALRILRLRRGAIAQTLILPVGALATVHATSQAAGSGRFGLSPWFVYTLTAVLVVRIATSCHRLVYLPKAEWPGPIRAPWTRRETRYLLYALSLGALVFFLNMLQVVVLILVGQTWVQNPTDNLPRWLVLVLQSPALYVLGRFSMVLPATAMDHKADLLSSWENTRGNGWRIFVIAAGLPSILGTVLGVLHRENATALELLALAALSVVLIVFQVASLSLAYRELSMAQAHAGATG